MQIPRLVNDKHLLALPINWRYALATWPFMKEDSGTKINFHLRDEIKTLEISDRGDVK